jgi:hypothetical protein
MDELLGRVVGYPGHKKIALSGVQKFFQNAGQIIDNTSWMRRISLRGSTG